MLRFAEATGVNKGLRDLMVARIIASTSKPGSDCIIVYWNIIVLVSLSPTVPARYYGATAKGDGLRQRHDFA